MYFIKYLNNSSDLAIFEARDKFDLYYTFYKYEIGHVSDISMKENHVEILLYTGETKPKPDTNYRPVVTESGTILYLEGATYPGDWKFKQYTTNLMTKYDAADHETISEPDEDYYSVSEHILTSESETEEDILKKLEEQNDEEEEETMEDRATNIYYSVKKTGFYT